MPDIADTGRGMTPGEQRALEKAGLGQYGKAGLPALTQIQNNQAVAQNQANCSNGGGGAGGNDAASGPAGTNGVNPKLMDNYQCGLDKWNAANPNSGVQWNIISGRRAVGQSDVEHSQHFTGNAIDLQASKDGKAFANIGKQYVGTDTYRLYESMGVAMSQCDSNMNWGGNFQDGNSFDYMHYGMGQKDTKNGNLFRGQSYKYAPNSDLSTAEYKGSTDPTIANHNNTIGNTNPQTAQPGQADPASPAGGSQSAGCGNGNGGCAPVNSAAPAAASSMAGGQGMASPITDMVSSLASGGIGGIQQALQGAIGQAMGSLGNLGGMIGQAMSAAGMPDPTSMISGMVSQQLQKIGIQ